MKKTVLSRIFSFVLALFLAITLLASAMAGYVRGTVADPQNVKNAVTGSDFAAALYSEILAKWDNLISICGIADTAPMLEILTEERVQADVLAYYDAAYHGKQDVDTEALEKALEEKLWAYAESLENTDRSDKELKKNIADLVKACMDEYRTSVRVPLLHTLLGALTRRKKWLNVGEIGAAAFACLLLLFLFFLQEKRRYTLYFAAVATATDTVLILGGGLFAKAIDLVNRLPLAESALRDLAVICANDMLTKLLILGAAFLAVTLILLLVFVLTGLTKKRG